MKFSNHARLGWAGLWLGAAISAAAAAAPSQDLLVELTLSDRETTILSAVRDGVATLYEEPGFAVMLHRVGRIAPLPPEQFAGLNRPSYRNLMRRPGLFRPGRAGDKPPQSPLAISLRVSVFRVSRIVPSEVGCFPVQDWPSDRPIWRLDCLNAPAGPVASEPLSVFCTSEPPEFGPPDEITENHSRNYTLGREVLLAGVFHKLYAGKDLAGQRRTYPVVIAWEVRQARAAAPAGDAGLAGLIRAIIPAGILVLLVAGFYLMRRLTGKPSVAGRQAGAGAPRHTDGPVTEIDPLLASAAEQYRKERRFDDTTNSES